MTTRTIVDAMFGGVVGLALVATFYGVPLLFPSPDQSNIETVVEFYVVVDNSGSVGLNYFSCAVTLVAQFVVARGLQAAWARLAQKPA